MKKRQDEPGVAVKTPPQAKRPVPKTTRPALPAREEFLEAMLDGTNRNYVPIRTRFVQSKTPDDDGTLAGPLAKIVRSRTASYLDAFLLIHALASSSEPYDATYPAQTWVRALGLDVNVGSGDEQSSIEIAKSTWSKIVRRLAELHLVDRKRKDNMMSYILLDESGDGSAYARPKTESHGTWFQLPLSYWRDDHYLTMSLPAKAMLLICLSLDHTFKLPAERAPQWYGISASTAKRGLSELVKANILTFESGWVVDPKSTIGLREQRQYSLVGEWSLTSRKKNSKRPPKFTGAATKAKNASTAGVSDDSATT